MIIMLLILSKKTPQDCRESLMEALGTGNIRGNVGRLGKTASCKFRVANSYNPRRRGMGVIRVSCVGKIEPSRGGSRVTATCRYGPSLWMLLLFYIASFLLIGWRMQDVQLLPLAALLALIVPVLMLVWMFFSTWGNDGDEVKLELTQFLEYVLK